jgi:hypothetical protein
LEIEVRIRSGGKNGARVRGLLWSAFVVEPTQPVATPASAGGVRMPRAMVFFLLDFVVCRTGPVLGRVIEVLKGGEQRDRGKTRVQYFLRD